MRDVPDLPGHKTIRTATRRELLKLAPLAATAAFFVPAWRRKLLAGGLAFTDRIGAATFRAGHLAPTFAEWAGIAAPIADDGRSFAALLDGTPPMLGAWRRVVPLEQWKEVPMPEFPIPVPDYKGLRSARYTYIEYKTGDRELYDNLNDPYQLRNIARTVNAALLQQLSTRTAELAGCRAAACRAAEDRPLP